MYTKIVVPLDGSKLAESALPHLETIGKGCNVAEVLLVSVTEKISGRLGPNVTFEQFVPEKNVGVKPALLGGYQSGIIYASVDAPQQEIPVSMGKMAKTAADYLRRIGVGLDKKGFNVTATVLAGNPAQEIVNYAESMGADLIIMASRGKSGASRWDMGNIADKVIRASNISVLLVKPPAGFKETKKKRKGVAS